MTADIDPAFTFSARSGSMRHVARKTLRGAFGALVVAGLGFGGGQALASPAEAQGAAGTCLRDEAAACNANCRETLGNNYIGRCTKNAYGHVSCQCVQVIFP
jgi:hypothetical protein